VGGVVNILSTRLPRQAPLWAWPLRCRLCHQPLNIWDLLALVNLALRRGRCRYCRGRLSWQYPLVELAAGITFALLYWRWGLSLYLFSYSFYGAVLILVFIVDWRHRLILNEVTYPAMLVALALSLWHPRPGLLGALGGGAFGGGLFLALYLVAAWLYRREDALGFGDVKLALLIGLMMGWPGVLAALFLGALLGALGGLYLMLFAGRSRKATMPYGTALSAGALLTLLGRPDAWG